jgi:Ras-related protein Rab-6A
MGDSARIAIPAAKFKVVFLGDQSVGKTSIIQRYNKDSFDLKSHVTIPYSSEALTMPRRSLQSVLISFRRT